MEVRAPAKINLFLNVIERRPDGYHNIETVYQSVDLADRLWLESVEGETVTLRCEDYDLPTDRNNLVVRAAELMCQRFPGRIGGMEITLEKQIPPGSGLGGGSADGAATLRAINEMFGLGLGAAELRDLAAEIGMDVPFLIEGGRAVGTARGDVIEPLPPGQPGWVVIIIPEVKISTRWAYEQVGLLIPAEAPGVRCFAEALARNSLESWVSQCFNVFEQVVFPVYPELQSIRDRLLAEGCAGAFLSGSGSALVGLAREKEVAERVACRLRQSFRHVKAVPFL